jgi:thiol-disulfide isomerase/thioredoxin
MRVMLLAAFILIAHVPKAAQGSVPAGKIPRLNKNNLREQHRQVLTGLVVPLSEGNFSSVISGDRHMLVEFMTPWCGHCKKLAPVWHEFAVQVRLEIICSPRSAPSNCHTPFAPPPCSPQQQQN